MKMDFVLKFVVFFSISLFVACSGQAPDKNQGSKVFSEDLRPLVADIEGRISEASEEVLPDTLFQYYGRLAELYASAHEWDSVYKKVNRIFRIALKQRNYELATPYLAQFSKLTMAENDTLGAKMTEFYGLLLYYQGDYELALEPYEQCVKVWERYPLSSRLLGCYNMLGIIYSILGDYPLAETIHDAAIKGHVELNEIGGSRKHRLNLGKAQLSQGKWEEAIPNFEGAHAINPYKDGLYEYNMARALSQGKQFGRAFSFAQQALSKRRTFEGYTLLSLTEAYEGVAMIHFEKGEYQKAQEYYQLSVNEAVTEFPRGHRAIGKARIFLADTYHQQGLYQLALEEYQRALAVFLPQVPITDLSYCPRSEEIVSREIWILEVLQRKGEVYMDLFKQTQQAEYLQYASTHFQATIDFINHIKLLYTEKGAKTFLGDYSLPYSEAAIDAYVQLSQQNVEEDYLAKAYYLVRQSTAFLLRETVNDQRALEVASIPVDTINLLRGINNQITELQEEIVSAENASYRDSLNTLVLQRKRERLALLDKIENQYPQYYQLKYDLEPAPLERLQQQLDPGGLVVNYFVGEEKGYVFAFNQQQLEVFPFEINDSFYENIRQFRQTLADLDYIREDPEGAEQQFLSSSHALYQVLLDPVLRTFSNTPIDKLTIVPNGVLNYLSFECFTQKPVDDWLETEAFLLSDYSITYAYYADLLLAETEESSGNSRFLGFGTEYDDRTLDALNLAGQDSVTNPQIKESLRGKKLSKLLFADDEVSEVADLVGGEAFLNQQATKTNFLDHSPSYDIIHIAAHSFIDDQNDSTAFIAFHQDEAQPDFLLSLPEIYGLDLNAKLVALSSCQTSVGALRRSEGVMSLARAFNFAGSESMLASQWSIADRSSYLIMKTFYGYLKEGLPKDEALQKAKLDYLTDDNISNPAYRLPAYWGAIVLIGDPEPLAFASNAYKWWGLAAIVAILLFLLYRRQLRSQ